MDGKILYYLLRQRAYVFYVPQKITKPRGSRDKVSKVDSLLWIYYEINYNISIKPWNKKHQKHITNAKKRNKILKFKYVGVQTFED